MWIADHNREQFLNLLQVEGAAADAAAIEHLSEATKSLPRGTIRLIWERRPTNGVLPALLVTPAAEAREFFAWTNTYLSGWRPITSLFRVTADQHLRELLEVKSNYDSVWRYRNAVLGLVLTEAAVHAPPSSAGGEETASAVSVCAATCSFAMGRAMGLGWPNLAAVAQKWHRSHAVGRHRGLTRGVGELLEPWSVLAEIGGLPTKAQCGTRGVSEAVVAICGALHARDEVDSGALALLTREWPELEKAFQSMKESRERRVQALEMVMDGVSRRRRRSLQSAVIGLGLLASRIAPGTLEHGGLLNPHADKIKGLMLWYGLFSGITRSARMVDHYGSLGRRILRDMLVDETVFSSPSCDIGVDELEVISASESSLQDVHRAKAEQLVIEVHPCINTIAPWSIGEGRRTVAQGELFDDEARRLETDVRELNYAAEKLLKRLRRLSWRRN